jgi:hypothetical protein
MIAERRGHVKALAFTREVREITERGNDAADAEPTRSATKRQRERLPTVAWEKRPFVRCAL